MPDHVHFFCAHKSTLDKSQQSSVNESVSLQRFIGKWKEWTAKYGCQRAQVSTPLWQEEFFDHVLRSQESYEEKWIYVLDNPVRAGLVAAAADWPFQGEIHPLRYEG